MLQYKILSILFFTVGTLAVFYSKKLALMSLEKTDRQFNRPFDEDEIVLNSVMFKFIGIILIGFSIYAIYCVFK
jgi:NADH:ubiquinone oxidoreductase subunit K